jgi:hypothetical protein
MVMSICGDKQGRGRAARANTCPLDLLAIYRILGENWGPTSNQTKIQFKKKNIFIIKHIKKTIIFLKKKIETK